MQIVSLMMTGKCIDLTFELSISAAKYSFQYKLPLADSIIFATAKAYQATI